MELFDIHCHILPGVDDGSRNIETSLEMIDIAYSEGTRRIILTPHYILGHNTYTYAELDQKFDELKQTIYESGKYPDLELYLGNEVLYEEGIVQKLRDGEIHTMNGTKYVLLEYNIRTPFSEIMHSIDELTQARFWPIIAHVERYQAFEDHLDRVDEILDRGALLQMNISSVEGGFLNENKRWCRKLVKKGCITFFGTDAHNTDSRAPYVQEYSKWIEKHCKADAAWMLNEAAEHIIDGKYID
ncbi:MAG: protein tyrosine phosphatase [Eubacterium sp.]|nr:protein tyrosine phosphatase [Eubacterium sp.]